MTGIELLVIDEHTTLAQFEQQMRWNAAYYGLVGR
jgi:L-arabinose isomerase